MHTGDHTLQRLRTLSVRGAARVGRLLLAQGERGVRGGPARGQGP